MYNLEIEWQQEEFNMNRPTYWRRQLNKYSSNHGVVEPMTVYRGGTNVHGYSWTADLEVAEFFAQRTLTFEKNDWPRRLNMKYSLGTRVWTAVVNPEAIVFVNNERNEHEVVIKTWLKSAWLEQPQIVLDLR